jgi:hypothetical protein
MIETRKVYEEMGDGKRTTPMDLDEIKGIGEHVLDLETKELLKNKGDSPHPKFFLFRKNGGVAVFFVDGTLMNSGSSKSELAKKVREMIKHHDAIATAFFSDSYIAEGMSAEAERMCVMLGLNLVEGAKIGLVKNLREVLLLQIESRLGCLMLCQFYRREGKKIVLEERNEKKPDQAEGRFAGFFPQGNEGHA